MVKGAALSCLLSCVLVLFLNIVSANIDDPQHKQVYVVYMGSLPSKPEYTPISHHMNILQEVTGESLTEGRLVRSYKRSFNGFAAKLTKSEREQVAGMEGVVSVFPSKNLKIHTTNSWDFMGLKEGKNTKRNLAVESDTIIGVIDTGIWPESESFSDKGFGPPPKKWKGVCSGGGKNFTCNNKLIGARDYTGEGTRDNQGHGTHTASIAAGNAVAGASFFGIGNGTARGGVPASRIAAYKVCTETGCTTEAILSAFDDAIADGVDIISISVGGDDEPVSYEEDAVAIGAFHAMAKGILTVNSAGNNGPDPATVMSVAPWILTVAASSTNRGFVAKVVLGNNKTLVGRSVNAYDLKEKNYPFVYGRSLNGSQVKDKILVSSYSVSSMRAVATIIRDYLDFASISPRPGSALSQDDFDYLVSYVNSTKSPQGTVLKSESIFNQKAPRVVSFSARGPNTIAADLLKPDITAPGVEILAAFSPLAPLSTEDARHVKYSVLSGTSMSCPHVSGVAAYIKTFHPDWSPSAIKSAIMTTAWTMNASETGFTSTEFSYGAGHVDPIAALNPGLVYELEKADHIAFLSGLNYNSKTLKIISGEAATCNGKTLPRNLNYPSMSAKISRSGGSFTVTFNRTVTNVGAPISTYKSNILAGHGTKLTVKVSPSVLSMKSLNEKQSFLVTVSGANLDAKLPSSASLIWSDGTHNVRSPIVIYTDGYDFKFYCCRILVYVVYMGSLPSRPDYTPMSDHMNILQEVTGESSIQSRLVRSYKRSFNGFAARLTETERDRVAEMEGVVSVFPSRRLHIQTTNSWDFMGLKKGKHTKRNLAVESDTIIGVIDTGIWPESESFSGKGFGPPPKKWKGVCSGGKNFTCNNKLIGARDYTGEGTRDNEGHGSHTASTASGNAVAGTSFFGIGNGTARGGVPASRIAAYKVCTKTGCTAEDTLSAFDDAIADGVDLISISLGGDLALKYEEDTIAIGAFHAMAKGILTVNSAGNSGPDPGSVISVAPWMLSVASSTTNRAFVTKVVLGNGKTLNGKAVNPFDLKGKKYPLVYGKSAGLPACDTKAAEQCVERCVDESLVKGKILVCSSFEGLETALSMGAVASIFINPEDYAAIHALPFSAISQDDFDSLVSYINSTKSPEASVLNTETIFNQTAPKVVSFSGRGPNPIASDILKPDITAPGVEILAAYSLGASPVPPHKHENDTRRVNYAVLAGTSISCPHVTGVAAYVKTFYPEWSASMIKSAIMTTAWPMNATGAGFTSTEFAYGAGHVDPIAALNPGLVYESDKTDYMAFLCGMNYNETSLKIIAGEAVTCSGKTTLQRNLNYPSMSAKLQRSNSSFTVTFDRTVTNVGAPNSTYKSNILAGHGTKLTVKVTPSVLSMKSMNEKQSFTVTVSGSNLDTEMPSSANLIWSDGTHSVRSPIVIYTYGNK
ncbi:unnamed protein product [Cochlearia groenlandica]